MKMKRTFLLAIALLLSASTAFAATTTLKWTAGWDNFGEPLNYKKSKVSYSVDAAKSTLTVTFTLESANPNKIYQVGINFFCTTFPVTFGNFPTSGGGGTCESITRQGVSKGVAAVELGVVTTDEHGNGSFKVTVGPIASGTYDLEFQTRDGGGCNLKGGGSDCADDFQSPGPTFGDAITITIP
jgi:hypothetical protein